MSEILDFIVIFLLVVAIIYGFILNKKIVLIQNSKKELANLFKSFDNTILKAQIGIDELKKVSNEVSNVLQQKLDKAAFVVDDLSFLSERAVEISNNMEKIVSSVKKPTKPVDTAETVYSAEIIKNMKQTAAKEKERTTILTPATRNTDTKKTKLLEGMLEKIAEKRTAKEAISNDNKGSFYKANPLNNDKVDSKTVAEMLKSLGYGDS